MTFKKTKIASAITFILLSFIQMSLLEGSGIDELTQIYLLTLGIIAIIVIFIIYYFEKKKLNKTGEIVNMSITLKDFFLFVGVMLYLFTKYALNKYIEISIILYIISIISLSVSILIIYKKSAK